MNRTTLRRFLFVMLALVAAQGLRAGVAEATSSMTGHWQGSTHVIVTWCGQTELTISLDIRADGSVTGKIGDAELTNAQLRERRHRLGQENTRRATHIIKGELKGAIVGAEGISRPEVFIHLRLEGAHLAGSLATSGSKMGGKDTMVLTATSLRLVRS